MKTFKYFFASVLAMVFCVFTVSCDKNTELSGETPQTGELLNIETTIQTTTRSGIKSQFTVGDKIGLILTHENTQNIFKNDLATGVNLSSTYSAGNKWEQNIYLGDEKANVYAYYPHDLTVFDPAKPVISIYQPKQVDVLYGTHAVNTTQYVNRFNPTATLNLKHATAVTEFLLKKENYNGKGEITKVEITQKQGADLLITNIFVNVVTGEVDDALDDGVGIVLEKEDGLLMTLSPNFPTNGIQAFIRLISKVKKQGDLLVTFTIDGREYIWNVPANTEWKAGYKYIYNITVQGTELILESVIIEEYESGGSDSVTLQ